MLSSTISILDKRRQGATLELLQLFPDIPASLEVGTGANCSTLRTKTNYRLPFVLDLTTH